MPKEVIVLNYNGNEIQCEVLVYPTKKGHSKFRMPLLLSLFRFCYSPTSSFTPTAILNRAVSIRNPVAHTASAIKTSGREGIYSLT